MGYQADSIANYFIDKSNEGLMYDLNPMKLSKQLMVLLYPNIIMLMIRLA